MIFLANMPPTCGYCTKKSTFSQNAHKKIHFLPKKRAKKSTFSQKQGEKVHFFPKRIPPNPDLATGLGFLSDVWLGIGQWCWKTQIFALYGLNSQTIPLMIPDKIVIYYDLKCLGNWCSVLGKSRSFAPPPQKKFLATPLDLTLWACCEPSMSLHLTPWACCELFVRSTNELNMQG